MKPTLPPMASAVYHDKAADSVYESLDVDNKTQLFSSNHREPLDYTYPHTTLSVELQNRSSSNALTRAPMVEPEPLYHDVGPDASMQSANANLYTKSHYRNGNSSGRNILEEDKVKSNAKVCVVVTYYDIVTLHFCLMADSRIKGTKDCL